MGRWWDPRDLIYSAAVGLGLKFKSANSNNIFIKCDESPSADRTLTLRLGNQNRILDFGALTGANISIVGGVVTITLKGATNVNLPLSGTLQGNNVVSVSVTGGDVILSAVQSDAAVLIATGTPGTTRTITLPNTQKVLWVYNNSDSNLTLSAGAGTTVTLVPGTKDQIYTDGATNVVSLAFPTSVAWTPVLKGGTTAGTPTYVSRVGQYKVFGNLVWVFAYIEISAKGGMAGDVIIDGLPYTVQSSRAYAMALSIFNKITYAGMLTLRAMAGTTTIKLVENPSGGAPAFVQDTAIDNATYIEFTGTFKRSL